MGRLSVLLAAAAAAACAVAAQGAGDKAMPVEGQTRPQAVTVKVFNESAREIGRSPGTVIAPGRIITRRSLLQSAADVRVTVGGVEDRLVTAVVRDEACADTVILALDMSRVAVKSPVLSAVPPEVGQTLLVLAADESIEAVVANVRRLPFGYLICELDKVLGPALAGCPVVDETGSLVGIAASARGERGPVGLCIAGGIVRSSDNVDAIALSFWLETNRTRKPGTETFASGLEAAWAGDFARAAKLLQQATLADDNRSEWWLLLGWCRNEAGLYVEATDALKQALALEGESARVLASLAVSYAQLGRFEEALDAYTRSVGMAEPDEVDGQFCQLLADAGFHSRIIGYYSAAVAKSPRNHRLRYGLACVYAASDRHWDAVGEFRRCVEIDDEFEAAWRELGRSLLAVGEYRQALAAEKTALTITPRDFEALVVAGECNMRLGHVDDAAFLFKKATEVKADHPPAWHKLGLAYYSLSQFGRAANALEACVRQTPRDSIAHSYLGRALCETADFDRAIEHHRLALELDGDNAEFQYHLARTFLVSWRFEDAIPAYARALELDPYHVKAQVGTAVTLKRMGYIDKAMEAFAEAEKIDSAYAENYYQWGRALREGKKYEDALEKYSRAVALDPKMHPAFFEMGLCQVALEMYDKAVPTFESAVQTEGGDTESHYYLAFCLEKTGRYRQALHACAHTVRLRRRHALAYLVRGKAHWHLGENHMAAFALRQALRFQNDLEEGHYYLARAYLRLGDRASAARQLTELQELGSDLARPIENLVRE